MPPRLTSLRAIGAQMPSTIRPFSSTAPVLAYGDSFSPGTPSSSSRLLAMRNDRRGADRDGNASSDPRMDSASRLAARFKDRHEQAAKTKQAQVDFLREQKNSNDYLRQMPRAFRQGDVYSPHDMSPKEMEKWRRRSPRTNDIVDALGLSPLDMYKNFTLVQEFTTTSGMVIPSHMSRLRPVNQRKIAKMIRRIQGMGLYPTIHDHPESLRNTFFVKATRR